MRVALPLAVVAGWLGLALAAPWLDLDPRSIDLERVLDGPGWQALLGYDELGRGLGARLVHGARTSFAVAGAVVTISLVVGTCIGMSSAWLGGVWDLVIARVMDVFLAFPGILLAIAIAGMLGPGIENVVFALAMTGWVGFARLARAQALSWKERDHVMAAVALGLPLRWILARHILPLIAAPLVIEATFAVGGVIIAESGLSFLGLGVQPPDPSWGTIVREGTRYMLVAPHLVIAPALALLSVVLSVNLLGDRLRDRLDARTVTATGPLREAHDAS